MDVGYIVIAALLATYVITGLVLFFRAKGAKGPAGKQK
jgi:hypothetical protein